jgi:hypothetical protein
MKNEGESLADYAKRISEQLKESEAARRRDEPRFDMECVAFEKLRTLGLENVTDGVIALNGEVTAQHTTGVIDLVALAGCELRVISYHYSQVQVPYADLMRLREYRDTESVDRATVRCVRQLMVAQRAEAQAWLDANPEESP